VAQVAVANRTAERAQRLAASVGGRAIDLGDLPAALAEADLVLSSTGATGYVIPTDAVARAGQRRGGRPQVYVDLAVPRDVPPEVAQLPGVTVVDLEQLAHELAADGPAPGLDDVRSIIAGETAAFLAAQRAESVAPTVVALRAHARSVVEAELSRLDTRLGEVDERVRTEVAQTVHRVVEKLLHTPTVRVKELAGSPDGAGYAQALRALFDLPAERVEAVINPTGLGQSAGSGAAGGERR
jgi:glutamyl-tRNA reductase